MASWAFSRDESRMLSYYLGEIRFQAAVARRGGALMLDDSAEGQQRFMWAQMFLGACALMSKQLWPVNKTPRSKWRSANLRRMLGVDGPSVLKSRDARNWLEHIDEKFDELIVPGVNTTDFLIAPKSIVEVNDNHYLRCLDQQAGILSIAGLDVPYKEVLAETQRLDSEAAARISEMDEIVFGRSAVR